MQYIYIIILLSNANTAGRNSFMKRIGYIMQGKNTNTTLAALAGPPHNLPAPYNGPPYSGIRYRGGSIRRFGKRGILAACLLGTHHLQCHYGGGKQRDSGGERKHSQRDL